MARTNYIWDEVNDTLLAETDEAGNTIAEYTHEPGQFGPLICQRRNGHTYYHHYDGLGSTRALTDESGNVTDTYTYDAWGNEVADSGTTVNPFRWVGQVGYYFDYILGTFYIRARAYSPMTGRWASHDPRGFQDGRNMYAYVRSRPNTLLDPGGTLTWSTDEVPKYHYTTTVLAIRGSPPDPPQTREMEERELAETRPRADLTFECICPCRPIFGYCLRGWRLSDKGLSIKFFFDVYLRPQQPADKLDWMKRCEDDHIKDYVKWANQKGKTVAETVEGNVQQVTFSTAEKCGRVIADMFNVKVGASMVGEIERSHAYWDEHLHVWEDPGRRQ